MEEVILAEKPGVRLAGTVLVAPLAGPAAWAGCRADGRRVNDGFDRGEGFGAYVKYNKSELPRFVEWKQMGEQEYVIGFGPCNCGVEGRHIDEEQGVRPCESSIDRL